jgi:hypothetical protein
MFGLFFRAKFQGISPENMAKNMVLTYLHFRICMVVSIDDDLVGGFILV